MTESEKVQHYEFHSSITAEERDFYLKAYPTPEHVRDRRTHCTTCKMHLGTSPGNIENIKMHPILRVTQCPKCQEFYNCGEFSKGEDGSELYCRWCGQGGEVYCCSNCPFVFCKSCITKNLSRGVVADIEQNENWKCFSCAPKIIWPLRAIHWALMNYIEKQKKEIEAKNLPEEEKLKELNKDRSNCCRLAKAKCGNLSDSMDSIDSSASKRSSASAAKKKQSTPNALTPTAKRQKTSNSEVVCTPDLMSMLEPDCQLTTGTPKARPQQNLTITPKVLTVQHNFSPATLQQRSLAPPPLVLRNTSVQLRPLSSNTSPAPLIKRTIVSPRTPSPAGSQSPVYHTINGYRIDLNSAAQQGTYRLPNGKLIQVKRQSAPVTSPMNSTPPPVNNWQQRTPAQSPVQRIQVTQTPRGFVSIQQPSNSTPAQAVRYPNMVGNTVISSHNQNGPQIQIQMGNGGVNVVAGQSGAGQPVQIRPIMVRHNFPNSSYGNARTQFQDQIFNAMEICQHLTGKIQTLTNSNAYKTAKNYLELKELYIHLSYLLTYAIGRFKGLQDKCLGDMRQLGFGTDADSLENGQLAAGVDYVRYGQLEDVELFTSSMNSFHNQIYEYRKSLLTNIDELEQRPPLSPLHPLNGVNDNVKDESFQQQQNNSTQQRKTNDWHSTSNKYDDDDDDDVQEVPLADESLACYKDSYAVDDDAQDNDNDNTENEYYGGTGGGGGGGQRGTEDVMRREEESHAYDRKLTRLIQQYPSIWCTRHPDYGNFEVTRKQWRTIASHFKYSADMKMRWKNIRKRYVRIERRMHEGKRFNGYFDKATNFLINRDRQMNDWIQVDCGTDDGDVYERQKLDQIEKELYKEKNSKNENYRQKTNNEDSHCLMDSNHPIEIKPLDMKIIHFVKCNPVLWRKSSDPQFNKMDEQTRKSLWMHLWKSVPSVRCSDLVDRWTQLYEMYKTFRLKTIKSERALAALEIKYSKYLAKLYFLYKIEEDELQNEDNGLIYGDVLDDEDELGTTGSSKLLDKPDDKEFLLELVRAVRHYPQIWDENHADYHDVLYRAETWQEIAGILEKFQHKQASDNEDDEIEIVEPKTDTITLDSDEETTPSKISVRSNQKMTPFKFQQPVNKVNISAKISPVTSSSTPEPMLVPMGSKQDDDNLSTGEEMTDFMAAAHSLLASMLEVDIIEGDEEIIVGGKPRPKKQPRKKTTNKPNPTLLKQKKLLERQKMEEIKRNDLKLKMNCVVNVQRMDSVVPNFKEKLDEFERKRKEWREAQAQKSEHLKKVKKAKEERLENEAKEAAEMAKNNAEIESIKTEKANNDEMEGVKSGKPIELTDTDENITKTTIATDNPFKIVSVSSLVEADAENIETKKTEIHEVDNSTNEIVEKMDESRTEIVTTADIMETKGKEAVKAENEVLKEATVELNIKEEVSRKSTETLEENNEDIKEKKEESILAEETKKKLEDENNTAEHSKEEQANNALTLESEKTKEEIEIAEKSIEKKEETDIAESSKKLPEKQEIADKLKIISKESDKKLNDLNSTAVNEGIENVDNNEDVKKVENSKPQTTAMEDESNAQNSSAGKIEIICKESDKKLNDLKSTGTAVVNEDIENADNNEDFEKVENSKPQTTTMEDGSNSQNASEVLQVLSTSEKLGIDSSENKSVEAQSEAMEVDEEICDEIDKQTAENVTEIATTTTTTEIVGKNELTENSKHINEGGTIHYDDHDENSKNLKITEHVSLKQTAITHLLEEVKEVVEYPETSDHETIKTTTTTINSHKEQIQNVNESMDVDISPLDGNNSKSNELQLNATTTTAQSDVEMALPIDFNLESDKE